MKMTYLIAFVTLVTLLGAVKPAQASQPVGVIGGQTIDIIERPYMASLRDSDGNHFCGGAVIGDNWVLTAAHCLRTQGRLSRVVVGATELTQGGQSIAVRDTILHPNYRDIIGIDVNDIALIRLVNDVGSNISLLQLADNDVANIAAQPGDIGTFSGWGRFDESLLNTSTELRTADISIISNTSCQASYSKYAVADENICVFSQGVFGCNGDSGGPLVVDVAGTEFVIGVASFGDVPNNCNGPTGFARVSEYKSWIDTAIQRAEQADNVQEFNACTWSYSYHGRRTGAGGLWGPVAHGRTCKERNVGETFSRSGYGGVYNFRCISVPISAPASLGHQFASCN